MASDIEVRHCRSLVALDRSGGVAAAARALGVAQSTVSETLASLERVIGTSLTVRRAGRGAMLTPTANALLPHAYALIAASESAVAALAGQNAGIVRLGVHESISSFLLPGPLRAMRQRWPGVDVQITIEPSATMRQRIKCFELDAAIFLAPVHSERAGEHDRGKLLSAVDLHFVVAPGHPLATKIVAREALGSQHMLFGDPSGELNVLLRRWLNGGFGNVPEPRSAGSMEGVKRGVLNGDAIGVVAGYAVREELAAETLVRLDLDSPLPGVALFSVTNYQAPRLLPLRYLIDEIAAAAQDIPLAGKAAA